MGIGEWAGLCAALMWTLSSMLWGRINLTALNINLCKNVIGTVMILLHVVLMATILGQPAFSAPWQSWGWLSLSGIFGIVVGDTFYFRSLQILGPRRALMMATCSPIVSAILGWSVLGESLSYLAITGIALTVCGVFVVVADRRAAKEAPGIVPGTLSIGILTGSLGAICQAVGGVFSKKGMRSAEGIEICNSAEATFIRIFVAAVVTTLIVWIYHRYIAAESSSQSHVPDSVSRKLILNRSTVKILIPATALGTWLGIWLSQVAYNFSDVAVAQTLLATCPLFAIPVVWHFHKHKITAYSLIGTLIALFGIAMVVRNS